MDIRERDRVYSILAALHRREISEDEGARRMLEVLDARQDVSFLLQEYLSIDKLCTREVSQSRNIICGNDSNSLE